LIGSKLGLRSAAGSNATLSPLYGEALSPLLTPQEQHNYYVTRASYLNCAIPSVTVFRGTLKLVQTRFTGPVNFANTFFLRRVEANGAIFSQPLIVQKLAGFV
jgi:hypothetical protein